MRLQMLRVIVERVDRQVMSLHQPLVL